MHSEGDEMKNSIFKDWNIGKWLFNILILVLTITILSFFINPVFAVGYVIMLAVHESGHILAAKGYGAQVRFGGFTPFGAYIQITDQTSVKANAIIAMSGPLSGLLNALIYFFIFYIMKDQTFLWLSFFAAVVSFLNLLPLNPFDGGKVISATFCYFPLVLVPLLLYSIIVYHVEQWLIYVQVFLIIYILFDVFRMHRNNRLERVFHIGSQFRVTIFFIYLMIVGLLAGLLLTMIMDFKTALIPHIIIPQECLDFIDQLKNFF